MARSRDTAGVCVFAPAPIVTAAVRDGIGRLRDAGAGGVVVSRAEEGVLAWLDGRWLRRAGRR